LAATARHAILPAMSRAQRLLDLIQALRRHRRPVTGAALAETLGVSLRTLYRDIGALQAQGADIAGEAGLGYVLRPGFTLPPLMFTPEEIEALALGSQWVAARADARLAGAARNALAKIGAVTPPELADVLDSSSLFVVSRGAAVGGEAYLPAIREAIRLERKLAIAYVDAEGGRSERTIWPFAVAFFDSARVVAAWCESRVDFRHFRLDRLEGLEALNLRYPRGRRVLMKEWRQDKKIPTADGN
jgi:predicted DNA-binding transcriptional regulator YafY